MSLDEFLKNKPLFYKEIDYSRMPRAWDSVKDKLKPFKVIHIVGTNGKGSTGRFLAQILYANGKSVGHYTSPHIFEFKERFWLNGKIVTSQNLKTAHQFLQEILNDEFKIKLSYFEYATLLSAVLFSKCDYFVCETGMGGEYDATNVFEKEISLFTPIGIDHTAVLGDTIEKIATTKFKAMNTKTNALVNDNIDKICFDIGNKIAKKLNTSLKFASEILNQNDKNQIKEYADKFNLAQFLISNLTLSCAGVKTLLGHLDISNLKALDLRGRCEKISSNLYIDVGHNELGAKAMAEIFSGKKLNIIYNSFLDKDFSLILKALKPIAKCVLIYDYESSERELGGELIQKSLDELGIKNTKFKDENLKDIKEAKNGEIYLVFGSFYLVEAFLRKLYN